MLGHVGFGKAHAKVPRQIDGIKFDMRQRMQKPDTPLNAALFALGHFVGRQQFGLCRAARAVRKIG